MARIKGCRPVRYTQDEKVALVTEIERRHRAGEGALRVIAASLGTTETSYYNWLKAGIRPSPRASREPKPSEPRVTQSIYSPAERERLMAEVDRHREGGSSITAACRAHGISDKSYRKWKDDAAPPPAMRPVEVTALVPVSAMALATPIPTQETLSLVAPGGYRIEGLSVESAAALLRALA